MLINKLKLNYFGRFQNKEIELKPGINLIYGDNEAGKSTIHTFIRGMLFGIERLRGRGSASKEDTYTKYLPWDYPGAYNGSMDIKLGEKEYRLCRSFHANDKSFTVLELSTGREVKLKDGLISELIPGLTESAFKNTVSIEQLKSQTDAGLASEVRNYITNLSVAKSREIDVAKAVSLLNGQRKQLEASQDIAALKELQVKIEEGLEKEEKLDQLTIQLSQLQVRERDITEQKETILKSIDNEAAGQMEQLPAILEKYRAYREFIRQENAIKTQNRELQDQIAAAQGEPDLRELKEDTARLQKLQSGVLEQEKHNVELQAQKNRLSSEAGRNILITLLPGCLAAIFVGIITRFAPAGLIAALLLAAAGIIGFLTLKGLHSKKQKVFDSEYRKIIQDKTSLQAEIDRLLHKYGASGIEELSEKQEEAIKTSYELGHRKEQQEELINRLKELEDSKDALYDTIMTYMQNFTAQEELTDMAMQNLQKIIADKKQETSGKLSEINHQHESCKLNIEKLKWEITALEGNEEELLKNQARFTELEQKQKEANVELEAVKLALTTIGELSADIHDSFGQQLNEAVSEVIDKVTGHKYTDLKVDEKLEVKVGWNGAYVPIDRLSAGTIDQVYFALRTAVADLLLGKDNVPILLDDSFAFYDEMRVKEALSELSQREQVILFTCHKREQILLGEMMMPYHFVDLSCG